MSNALRDISGTAVAGVWSAGIISYALARGVVTRNPRSVWNLTPTWAHGVAKSWGLSVITHGAEHLDPNRPYVVMSNHQSYADIIALYLGLPIQPGFVAKQEIRKVPFLGKAMEASGHVFINRSKRRDAIKTMARAAEEVRKGKTLVIFPEGTRSESETVAEFKKGAFYLAREAKVPIAPVGIRGSNRIIRKGSLRIRPGTVHVHIGPPISADEIQALSVTDLVSRVRAAICELADMPRV